MLVGPNPPGVLPQSYPDPDPDPDPEPYEMLLSDAPIDCGNAKAPDPEDGDNVGLTTPGGTETVQSHGSVPMLLPPELSI